MTMKGSIDYKYQWVNHKVKPKDQWKRLTLKCGDYNIFKIVIKRDTIDTESMTWYFEHLHFGSATKSSLVKNVKSVDELKEFLVEEAEKAMFKYTVGNGYKEK